jgi:hypothetical protein
MHLITMAHLGEAQGVIELFNLKRVSSQVFEGENLVCLITGEGPFEAATATASILGSKKFLSVINLGIAGALCPDYPVGSIHPVRSVYLVIDGKPQFKSFKSLDKGLDCVTSFERILSPERALPLTGIAKLVDREAWGVAMAAKTHNTHFSSYKLISDQAGSLGACEAVKEKAEEWSQLLAQYLKTILHNEKETPELFTLEGFHFTFTTQHQFEQLLKKISLRDELSPEEVLTSLPIESIRSEATSSKIKTKALLNIMEGRLDPLKEKLDRGLLLWKTPFERRGITLQTDATWEGPEVKVSFKVSNTDELEEKIKHLTELKLEPFLDLRNGNIHVE